MEATAVDMITREESLKGLLPVQYMAAARVAIARQLWVIIAMNEREIVCRTHGFDTFYGAELHIVIEGAQVKMTSVPVNEYNADAALCSESMDRLQKGIALALEEQELADRNLHPMHREKYGALVISKSYVVTPILVYINVLVLLAMIVSGISPLTPTAQSLYEWGGNFGPAVAAGQWWRLLTYMFLHGGALHLLGNTFALLYIGMFLEPLLGRFRFAAAYLLTGVSAALLSLAIHSTTVSVGASGAIFGMYGVFLSMLTTNHIKKSYRKTMLRSILFFVVFNLMYGLQGNTDNAAHIGGLISGMFVGYAYYPGIATRIDTGKQVLVTAVMAVIVTLLTFATVHYML
jgi:membrane associated rhomboid family serine protease